MTTKQQIRAEIERLYDGEAPKHDQQCDFNDGYFVGIDTIAQFIDTLESEKPMNQEGLDVTDFCKPIDPGIAQCIADHSWEMLEEDEKPTPNDLEEVAEKKYPIYWKNYPKDGIIRSESSYDTNKQCRDAFIAGAEWDRGQMMKEAKDGYVSGIIIHNDGDEEHYAVTYPNGKRPHSIMDKVKIIIL